MVSPGFIRAPSVASAASLVVANVVPLVGVLWFGWSLFGVMWLYWAENGVIGAFALARLLSTGDTSIWRALPWGAFFAVHFGGFWLGHGAFLYTAFGPDAGAMAGPMAEIARQAVPLAAVAPLALSHGASFVLHYLVGGEWRGATPMAEMFKPYGRVVVLHVVILFGGFAAQATGQGVMALVLLVVLKTGVDLGVHLAGHRARYRALDTEPPEIEGRTLHLGPPPRPWSVADRP